MRRYSKGQVLCRLKGHAAIITGEGKIRGYEGWPELFEISELDTTLEEGESAYQVEVIYKIVRKVS